MTFPYELVEPPDPARRAPWSEEKEESASHHWFIIICFAQLRAKNIEKDLQNPPETTGNHEKVIFWDTENFNMFTPVTDLLTETSIIDTSSEYNFW